MSALAMSSFPSSTSLRLLAIDGGGIKGLTALLILKRLMRTIKIEGGLASEPRPCEVFDLIGGNSTGGLIAIMLGRLGMTVDEAIAAYKQFGEIVFGQKPLAGNAGKLFLSAFSKAFYSTSKLQEAIQTVVTEANLDVNESFLGMKPLGCKTFVCVIRQQTSTAELLRNYETLAADQSNYDCKIWEAGSATAAAPVFFNSVTLKPSGVIFKDGGLRRNNPINELIRESESLREREWKDRRVGCVVSLGTGWTDPEEVPDRLDKFLRKCIDIATDSDDVAEQFEKSPFGKQLAENSRYFRFSVQQGMAALQMDDWKEIEKMDALTTKYLGKPDVSSLIQRCGISLLNPQPTTEAPTLTSLMPYHVCSNFLSRTSYSDILEAYFANDTNAFKRFVLWGLGGVGKTQIALDFARSKSSQLSIFWVRADRIENFLLDYQNILELLDNGRFHNLLPDNPKAVLSSTLKALEDNRSKWLLVLDNADDLKNFRKNSLENICLRDYLPQCGRTLITTRDSRFVGEIAGAEEGVQVRSMSPDEAKTLLLRSIPPELSGDSPECTDQDVEELNEELGQLPLAIAQAAANIRHLRTSLHSYVRMYRERKRRADLLDQAVHDLRRPPQSVLITWQISFDYISASDPTAGLLLSYLGFLHWESIPGGLLRALPGIDQLDTIQFARTVANLLQLALLEQPTDDNFQLHPMVHYWISARLDSQDRLQYLIPVLKLISAIFPIPRKKKDFSRLLLPHALELIDQAADLNVKSMPYARLMQVVASFFMHLGICNWSLHYISRALDMGLELYEPHNISLISLRMCKGLCLSKSAMRSRAVVEFRRCLEDLESANASEEVKASRRFSIRPNLIAALSCLGYPEETAKLQREQLEDEHNVLRDELQQMISTHDLSCYLIGLGQFDEAKILSDKVLDWANDENGGKFVATEGILLPWLNSKGKILAQSDLPKALEVFTDVLNRSLQILGPEDEDLWVAVSNVCKILYSLRRYDDMDDIIYPMLERAADSTFQGVALESATKMLSLLAVAKQRQGHFKEAETLQRLVLQWCLQLMDTWRLQFTEHDDNDFSTELEYPTFRMCIYGLCLVLAQQGRTKEMQEIRAEHRAVIDKAESKYGTIERYLQLDEERKQTYEQARKLAREGGRPVMDSSWWLKHKKGIEIAEYRFGRLFPDDETDGHDRRSANGEDPKRCETSSNPLDLPALLKESELPGNSIQDIPLQQQNQLSSRQKRRSEALEPNSPAKKTLRLSSIHELLSWKRQAKRQGD